MVVLSYCLNLKPLFSHLPENAYRKCDHTSWQPVLSVIFMEEGL